MNRIDLDDDNADDETYRAFMLAKYTGEANHKVAAHEHQFRERRREEMERSQAELGEQDQETTKNKAAVTHNDEKSEKWNMKHDPQEHERKREQEIMGANDNEMLLQIGEDAPSAYEKIMGHPEPNHELGEGSSPDDIQGSELGESTKEPFDAVHQPKSGDIEDDDFHFVMTDSLRHSELKNAVLNRNEEQTESEGEALATKMINEQAAIAKYDTKQEQKDEKDMRHMEVENDIGEALKRHHLQRDSEGRVVPNF